MDELVRIRNTVKPHNILLVLDAMTGQDAVNVALQFQEQVQFDGVILTKMDGDARGGAALSVRAVTGKPIKFASSGEKLDNFEYFHPDRVASRILGMGDVLSLIEKAETHHRREEGAGAGAEAAQEHLHLRGLPRPDPAGAQDGLAQQPARHDPRASPRTSSRACRWTTRRSTRSRPSSQSMTPEERRHPEIINGSRRRRIAAGSGSDIHAGQPVAQPVQAGAEDDEAAGFGPRCPRTRSRCSGTRVRREEVTNGNSDPTGPSGQQEASHVPHRGGGFSAALVTAGSSRPSASTTRRPIRPRSRWTRPKPRSGWRPALSPPTRCANSSVVKGIV